MVAARAEAAVLARRVASAAPVGAAAGPAEAARIREAIEVSRVRVRHVVVPAVQGLDPAAVVAQVAVAEARSRLARNRAVMAAGPGPDLPAAVGRVRREADLAAIAVARLLGAVGRARVAVARALEAMAVDLAVVLGAIGRGHRRVIRVATDVGTAIRSHAGAMGVGDRMTGVVIRVVMTKRRPSCRPVPKDCRVT
ncbi:MAG: hypothetical protein GY788_06475 [bacterium]|nr:hypothetical protein [bacterium]